MPFGHLREIFGTLRFRLTVWNTVVVLAMVVVTLWGLREGMRLTLWDEADKQLVEDAGEIRLTIEQLYPDFDAIHEELDRKAVSHSNHSFFVQIFDERGNVIWTSVNPPKQPLTDKLKVSRKPISSNQYRLMHAQLEKTGLPRWTIRVGTSFEPLDADVATLTRIMLLVGAVVLFVSPLGGYWLAGRATRPLAEIIDTTDRLHPSSLEQRLSIRGTRDELDRLSATINGFLDRIATYLEQNREFTANAAHELRSPLAAIQSSLEVTLNSDRTVDEYKELLLEVLDECGNLRILVNQLLLLAESDAGHLQVATEPIRLDRVVAKAMEMFQGVAEMANIELKVCRLNPARVIGDSGRLRQVINNLLDNAIKFTGAGGKVEVYLSLSPEGDEVILRVVDTGLGIPPEDLPHIFDRFYRGDKSRRRETKHRGTGLGLSICESIITSHLGTIEVGSVVNQGTTFTVRLPAAKPGESDMQTASSDAPGAVSAPSDDENDQATTPGDAVPSTQS